MFLHFNTYKHDKYTIKDSKHIMSLYFNILKQPRIKVIMIINVKIPTCVGILTSMSIKHIPSKSLENSMSSYLNILKHFSVRKRNRKPSAGNYPYSLKHMSSNQVSKHLLGTVPFHPLKMRWC